MDEQIVMDVDKNQVYNNLPYQILTLLLYFSYCYSFHLFFRATEVKIEMDSMKSYIKKLEGQR